MSRARTRGRGTRAGGKVIDRTITPIQAVLRTDQEIIDHVESCGEGVFPEAQPSTVVVTSTANNLRRVVATEVFTTAAEREPVVKLILRIGTRTEPGCSGLGRIAFICAGSTQERVERKQEFVVSELRCPVTPRVIDEGITSASGLVFDASAGRASTRILPSVVVVIGAVLEVVAPVCVAARGSHVQRRKNRTAVSATGGGGVVVGL